MTAERTRFLDGGGALGRLIARHDWSRTSLGPIEAWPDHVRTAVGFALRSPVAIALLLGEDGVLVYNDGYAVIAGSRHPEILGVPATAAWPEAADFNRHVLRTVLAGGTLSYRGQEFMLRRLGGAGERVLLDLDYSPIPDPDGRPIGAMALLTETTGQVRAEREARAEQERLRLMFEQAPGFMAVLQGPHHVFSLTNAAYRQLIGHRDVIGLPVRQALPDVAGQGYFELLDQVYCTGEAFVGTGLTAQLQRRPDAPLEERTLDFLYQPIRDAAGAVTGIFVEGTDITDRMRAERSLRESELRLRLSQEAGGIAALEVDIASGTVYGSDLLWELWGLAPRDSAPASLLESLVVPADRHVRSNERSRRDGTAPPRVEYRIRRADSGEERWIERHVEFIADPAGRPVKMFGVVRDVTEAKQAEFRQRLLTHELEHRIKNILATVSAIAAQTLRGTDPEAREALNRRLQALAGAHDLLNRTRWTAASLREVVEAAVAPFPTGRIAIDGPDLPLGPQRALSLALAVNELATNALKYGALSTEAGGVAIRWRREGADDAPRLRWTWSETGVAVAAPPARRGFGHFLLERVVAADFGGSVRIEYGAEGVQCLLDAPWRGPAAQAGDEEAAT